MVKIRTRVRRMSLRQDKRKSFDPVVVEEVEGGGHAAEAEVVVEEGPPRSMPVWETVL